MSDKSCTDRQESGHNLFAAMPWEERRTFLHGIPFGMKEDDLRSVLRSLDLKQPWKVHFLKKEDQTGMCSKWKWANCFLFYESQEEAAAVGEVLDGHQLKGWWKPFSACLARTDPNTGWYSWCLGCIIVGKHHIGYLEEEIMWCYCFAGTSLDEIKYWRVEIIFGISWRVLVKSLADFFADGIACAWSFHLRLEDGNGPAGFQAQAEPSSSNQ